MGTGAPRCPNLCCTRAAAPALRRSDRKHTRRMRASRRCVPSFFLLAAGFLEVAKQPKMILVVAKSSKIFWTCSHPPQPEQQDQRFIAASAAHALVRSIRRGKSGARRWAKCPALYQLWSLRAANARHEGLLPPLHWKALVLGVSHVVFHARGAGQYQYAREHAPHVCNTRYR